MEKQKLIGPIDTIKKSWNIVGNNKKYVVKIFLVSFLIYLVANIIFSVLIPSPKPKGLPYYGAGAGRMSATYNPYVRQGTSNIVIRNIIVQLINSVISIIVISFQTLAFLKLYDSQKLKMGELIKMTFGTLITALLTMFLFYLIVGAGIILLIIPGIIFSVMFVFALPIAIERGTKAVESLKMSKKLTSDYKWSLFWKNLVSRLLTVIIFLLPLLVTASISIYSISSLMQSFSPLGGKQINVLLVIVSVITSLFSLIYLVFGMFLVPGMNAMIGVVFYKDLLRIKGSVVQDQIPEPTIPSPEEQITENQDNSTLLAQETPQESLADQPVIEEQTSDSVENQ
jgi:hypothetical protein